MKVCCIQHDIVWQDPAENIRRMEERLKLAPAADLYVLSEMWATGFGDSPMMSREAIGWMMQKAHEKNAAVAGSLAVVADGKAWNRLYFDMPFNIVARYDKRHLFAPGGEKEHFVSGQHRTVVLWRGVRWMLQVCYDLRFPVFSRNRGDFDAILYVANWPQKRMLAWETLLRARAIENQCYVVGVNRVGNDPRCDYVGGSVVIDPYGRTMAACEDGEEGHAVAELDMFKLMEIRKKFPVLKDRDSFEINN